jgi:CheY-like chemotaxis protein
MAHILVVDDDTLVRAALVRLVRTVGHQASGASNGLEGLDICRAILPDLVITDLHMPVMNGLELIQACRQRWPELPFLVITGGGAQGSGRLIEQIHRFGVQTVLDKPVPVIILVREIAELLAD